MSTFYELDQEAARVRAQYSSDSGTAPTGSTSSHDPKAQDRHYFRLKDRLLSPKGLQDLPQPEPLIDGILMLDSIALLFGPPSSFKSFLVSDWALSVATGSWWHRREVAIGPVLYVIGEAASGFSQRQAAWTTGKGVHSLEDFEMRWLPEPVNLLDPAQVAALVQVAKELQPKLIVFDTLARCMAGGDENGPRDMGLVVDAADQLRRATGACVLFVHHTPKDGSKPRATPPSRAPCRPPSRYAATVRGSRSPATSRRTSQSSGPSIWSAGLWEIVARSTFPRAIPTVIPTTPVRECLGLCGNASRESVAPRRSCVRRWARWRKAPSTER